MSWPTWGLEITQLEECGAVIVCPSFEKEKGATPKSGVRSTLSRFYCFFCSAFFYSQAHRQLTWEKMRRGSLCLTWSMLLIIFGLPKFRWGVPWSMYPTFPRLLSQKLKDYISESNSFLLKLLQFLWHNILNP